MKQALFALFLGLPAAAQASCGPSPDPCALPDGEYHIVLPETGGASAPAVLYLHGAGGSGQSALRNRGMVDALTRRGYAVIAPTGGRSFGNRAGRVWNFYPGWEGRDERDFLMRVAADATDRFGLDRNRMLLSGFSAGGFMVYYLACAAPRSFAAYASVAGGFWRPHPQTCDGPVQLFHTHGWRDGTVPLEGRALRGGAFLQGDIFAGMEIWRAANRCAGEDPDAYSDTGPFWRRKWTDCAVGSALELALHPGGHGVPRGWADMALDWFEALPTAAD